MESAEDATKPDVQKFHVQSRIRHRYAKTVITSIVANNAAKAQEVVFKITLPESAFISAFQMEIDGKVYKANVKEKEAAKTQYMNAVFLGRTAAYVEQTVRDSSKFSVSVNVEKTKSVTFKLTYEELLKRELSAYKHVVNIDPGQIVPELLVEVYIEESSNLSLLEVSPLQETCELQLKPDTEVNTLAKIERPKPNEGVVRWSPSTEDQKKLNASGVRGQLLVRYDVDRTSNPEEILINNGYFVHFFAPLDLPVLRKHVVFVLDISGSMQGRKIEQVKDAMKTILSNVGSNDFFSLIIFSTDVRVWEPNSNEAHFKVERTFSYPIELPESVVVPATESNVEKAKLFVSFLLAQTSTNIHRALLRAIEVAHLGKKLHEVKKISGARPEPMIIFLTDGQPNVGESDPDRITSIVSMANKDAKAALFSLAFGEDADMEFLKKLSLQNCGFARKIYEAADAALQLRQFYRLVASPLLADVRFKYHDSQVVAGSVTNTIFRTFFDGSELVVAGRVCLDTVSGEIFSDAHGVRSNAPTCRPVVAWHGEADLMERLWAFLTIRQLLDDVTAGKNAVASRQRALELALKYSFVTPLTSLVVVKPDDSTEAASTERGDVPRNDASGMFAFPSAQGSLFGAPATANRTLSKNIKLQSLTAGASFPAFGSTPFPAGGTMFKSPCNAVFRSSTTLFGGGPPTFAANSENTPTSGSDTCGSTPFPVNTGASNVGRGSPWQSSAPAFGSSTASLFNFGVTPVAGLHATGSNATGSEVVKCKVTSLRVKCNIWCRYASTVMEQVFVNSGDTSQDINFNVYLTLSAVILHSSFSVNDNVKALRLASTKQGIESFKSSKNAERAAVLVNPSTSDGKRGVAVCIVLPPQSILTFKLQYEELLDDIENGYLYTCVLNPSQVVPDLQVTVYVEGYYKLADVRALRIIPYSPKEEVLEDAAVQFTEEHKKAVLSWCPDVAQQATLFGADCSMQLGVEYKTREPMFAPGGPAGEVVLDDSGQTIHVNLPAATSTEQSDTRHVLLVLHVGCEASHEARELIKAAARNLLHKLPHTDLFSIIICSTDVQVFGSTLLGSDRCHASQANITMATDGITQALVNVPQKGADIAAALTKALEMCGQTQQARTKILVLSAGGTSIAESQMSSVSARLKKANTSNTEVFSLACGSTVLLALLRDICAQSCGFACGLHKQTVERLLDLFFRVSRFDRINCVVVSQLPVFDGFMERFWLKEEIEKSAEDSKLKQSLTDATESDVL